MASLSRIACTLVLPRQLNPIPLTLSGRNMDLPHLLKQLELLYEGLYLLSCDEVADRNLEDEANRFFESSIAWAYGGSPGAEPRPEAGYGELFLLSE